MSIWFLYNLKIEGIKKDSKLWEWKASKADQLQTVRDPGHFKYPPAACAGVVLQGFTLYLLMCMPKANI